MSAFVGRFFLAGRNLFRKIKPWAETSCSARVFVLNNTRMDWVLVFHCLLFPVHDAERPLGQCEKFILSGIYSEGRDKACPFF